MESGSLPLDTATNGGIKMSRLPIHRTAAAAAACAEPPSSSALAASPRTHNNPRGLSALLTWRSLLQLCVGLMLVMVATSSSIYALVAAGVGCEPADCTEECRDPVPYSASGAFVKSALNETGVAARSDALLHVHQQIMNDLSPWLVYGVTPTAMRKTLTTNRPSRDGMAVHSVTIKGGFLVFDEADLEAEVDVGLFDKTKLFVDQLNSVLAMSGPGVIPDVTFLMTSSSLPYLTDMPRNALARITWTRRRAPVFSIAKADGDGDVLMPNPYFGNLAAWDKEVTKLLRRAERHANVAAWEKRLSKLHWRGSCSAKFDGVLPRLLLLLTWADYPGFDIAFSNQCLVRLWDKYRPTRVLSSAQLRMTSTLHKRRVEVEELVKFKYLLHLPGASSGSYSRSLQYQLTAGAVILKYDNPYREFYYSSMVEGVHYLTVNLTSVGDVFEWLRDNDVAAAAMGTASLRFASHHLRSAHLLSYWQQLLGSYAALQRFAVQLPARPCICPGIGPGVDAALAANPAIAALPRCRLIPKC